MSSLTDMILPIGLVFLGAFAITKLFSGQQPTCSGSVSQTCVGPLCWATCQETGGSTGTQGNGQQEGQGADIYGTPYQSYPWGSLNIGLPAGPGNVASPTPCDAFSWLTRWSECGFSW